MNEANQKAAAELAKIMEQMQKDHEAEMARAAWEQA